MGCRPLAGAAHQAHPADVLKGCLQLPPPHHLPGAAGSPQLCYVRCLLSTLVSWCLYLCAFQLQRLVSICLCWDGAGCAEDPEPARATGQPPCSERAITLPAKKSFLVGGLSSPVPLLAIFLSPLCLWQPPPACLASCLPAAFHFPLCKQARCSVTSSCPGLSQTMVPHSQHGHPVKPTGLHGGCLPLLSLSASLSL